MQIQRESRKSQFGWGKKRAGKKKKMMMMIQGCLMNSPPLSPLCKFLVEKGFYYKNSRNKIRSGEEKREDSTHNKIINNVSIINNTRIFLLTQKNAER